VRNPVKSHRSTEANAKRTQARIEEYLGVRDLLATWEMMPDDVQADHHNDILKLRARERNVRNYLAHRNSVEADI
jgi:hypothetical protein